MSRGWSSRACPPLLCGAWLVGALLAGGCMPTYRATVTQPPPQGEALAVEFVNNLPVIDTQICGEPVRLLVDLGGHDTVTLKPETIERIPAIQPTGRRHSSFNAAGKRTSNEEIVIPSLRLGSMSVTGIDGHSIELPEILRQHVDGYVGAAILKRFRLLVDYPEGMVLLPAAGPLATLDVSTWTSVRINGKLRMKAAVGDTPIQAGWDTGASHTVLDDDVADAVFHQREGAVRGELTLNDHAFGDIEFRVIELGGARVDALLGHNFFQRHRVLFDFTRGTAFIEPISRVVTVGRSAAPIGHPRGFPF
jgi:hypothetical protein